MLAGSSVIQIPSRIDLSSTSSPSLGGRYVVVKKLASSSSSREPFRVLAVPKRSDQMWLGDTSSPASSDHKLPWSEQLLDLDFPSALSGTSSGSSSSAVQRACRHAACLLCPCPCCKGYNSGASQLLATGRGGPAVLRAVCTDLGVDTTRCLCCVSARTSLQPCSEMPRARQAAYSAVKRLSCCYRI